MKAATDDQITQLRRHAVNNVTREIMANGLKLTWAQAHALGDEVIDWMRTRLDLKSSTTDHGITFKPDPSNRKMTNTNQVKAQIAAMLLTGPVTLSRALFCTAGRFQPFDIIDAANALVAEGKAIRTDATEHTWIRS